MIPEVHACSGYLVITPKRAYRDNAGALRPYQAHSRDAFKLHSRETASSAPGRQ
jgi:hypothetical protein